MVVTTNSILIYLRLAASITRLMQQKFQVINPLDAWGRLHSRKNGRLNRKIIYNFHGIGCSYEFENCQFSDIDVDYVDDKILLDPWKVNNFITENFNISIDRKEFYSLLSKIENKVTLINNFTLDGGF